MGVAGRVGLLRAVRNRHIYESPRHGMNRCIPGTVRVIDSDSNKYGLHHRPSLKQGMNPTRGLTPLADPHEGAALVGLSPGVNVPNSYSRSEEHTSELQSLRHLV